MAGMENGDLYGVLGVAKGATREEIRGAYRRLARKHHPDANPDDPRAEGRFKEIQRAYEVLSDPERRREYDEGPRTFFGQNGPRRTTGETDFAGADFSDFAGFSDLFGGSENLFGTRGGRLRVEKGEDVSVGVSLKFEEALEGATTRVSVPVEEGCNLCGGTGAALGTAPKACPECGGRGVKSRNQGFFALSEPCGRCGGEGTVVEKPCSRCAGAGRVRRNRHVTVRVPAGAKDGMRIRVPGRGSAGRRGGPAGDLYVVTRVAGHPVFERHGDDLHVEAPVSFVEAALGAEIEVPKPRGGTVRIKLPAGTQGGKRVRVRGAGAPNPKKKGEGTPVGTTVAAAGDLVVRVKVVVPEKLNRREKEILLAFDEERDEDVRSEMMRAARGSAGGAATGEETEAPRSEGA